MAEARAPAAAPVTWRPTVAPTCCWWLTTGRPLVRDYDDLVECSTFFTNLATGGLQYGVHLIVSVGRWGEKLRQAIR